MVDPLLADDQVEEAVDVARQAIEVSRGFSEVQYTLAVSNLGGALQAAGRRDEALAMHREALELVLRSGDSEQIAATRVVLADTLLEFGDDAEAEVEAVEALARADAGDFTFERARALLRLACIDVRRGDPDAAHVRLTSALASFGELDGPEPGAARDLLASLGSRPGRLRVRGMSHFLSWHVPLRHGACPR